MSELSIINGDILEKQSTYVKKYVDNGDAGLQKKIDQLSAKSTFSIKLNGETLPAVNNIVDLGEIGGGIVDIQLNDGTTIVNPTTNIATINNESAITDTNKNSLSSLTSVKSVVDYVESQKGTLRNVGCMGTSLKKLIEVQPKNNTTFYRITAMVMGGSQNPDFYGMMELTFGYNRPNNYCIAKWICYDKGKIKFSCPNPPEIHIYKKNDNSSIVIAGKCPDTTYQYCGLYIMTESADEATATYYNTGSTFSDYSTNYTEVSMEALLVTDVQDANGNSLVNKTNGIATITGGGGGGINSVTAETTAVTSGTIASIANDTLKLKIPYTTTENGSHWLNVWNVTESKWDKISVDTLKTEV